MNERTDKNERCQCEACTEFNEALKEYTSGPPMDSTFSDTSTTVDED